MSYITKQDLKKRPGWNIRLIEQFVPVPDKLEENPHSKYYPDMCLYSLSRIRGVEWTDEFHQVRKTKRGRKKKIAA